jgi:hypothetical protein
MTICRLLLLCAHSISHASFAVQTARTNFHSFLPYDLWIRTRSRAVIAISKWRDITNDGKGGSWDCKIGVIQWILDAI